MENNVIQICAYCKNPINEYESTTVCVRCNAVHHTNCWQINNGCAVLGCTVPVAVPEVPVVNEIPMQPVEAITPVQNMQADQTVQNLVPSQTVCGNCGTVFCDNEVFCAKCGAKRPTLDANRCIKCGTEVSSTEGFCRNCGQRTGFAVDNTFNPAINQFNVNLKSKKNNKKLPMIIAIVLAACIGISAIAIGSSSKKSKKAYEEYISNANEYLELILDAGSNVEDIVDTVQRYWYENIWEDKHGSDINSAIAYALVYMEDEIDDAKNYDVQVKALYEKLKKVPSGVKGDEKEKLEDICKVVNDLYGVYCEFYEMAIEPSGSYNSYSAANSSVTDKFIDYYEALRDLLK